MTTPGNDPAAADRDDAVADAAGPPDPAREIRSDDDRDVGWGDDLDRADAAERDARWYEEQRPPHWE